MKTQVLYTLTTALTVTLFPTATPRTSDSASDLQQNSKTADQSELFQTIGREHKGGGRFDFAWESGSLDSPRLMQEGGGSGDSGFSAKAAGNKEDANSDPLAWEVVDGKKTGNEVSTGSIAELAQAAVTGAASTDGAAVDKAEEVKPVASETPAPKKSGTVDLLKKPAMTKPAASISDLVGGANKPAADAPATTAGTPAGGDPMDPMEMIDGSAEDGFFIRGAALNDVFQFLAKAAELNYFHNAELATPTHVVTGQLQDGDPLKQMEELGLMYGITIYKKGKTVYAMTEGQLAQLPVKPFQYQLKYLRPADIESIKAILQPILTPGRGTVDYETKTNTMIVLDNEQKVAALKEILETLDQPKRQIAIEMRILRVTSASRNRIGVDWSTVLGEDGIALGADTALNNLFNLPDADSATQVITLTEDTVGRSGFASTNAGSLFGLAPGAAVSAASAVPGSGNVPGTSPSSTVSGDIGGGASAINSFTSESSGFNGALNNSVTTRTIETSGSGLVLDDVALDAVMRALNQGNLAEQESSPTLITEDNEQGIISIIDRVPIIVATVNQTSAGSNVTEEVRYRIDVDDPVDDPANTREIGVTMTITPTILPDNTIRMVMRPRTAQIVEFIRGAGSNGFVGNQYPRVAEATVDTIARVPDGSSLLVGGFYSQNNRNSENKVPILGDIPWVNFFFKSTDKEKTITSIVFVVTPTAYDAASPVDTMGMTKKLHDRQVLPFDHNWPDRKNPGFNHEANLGNTLGNALKLYPEVPEWNPLAAEHPINAEKTEAARAEQIPANHRKPRNPLIRIFGFGKN